MSQGTMYAPPSGMPARTTHALPANHVTPRRSSCRPVKSYVKTIVCYPQLSTKFQWRNFIESRIQDSERVHINLLAMAARKQAELLYGVHALSLFVSSRE